MMPRLKVFQAHLGFYDAIVAAPSQKAAIAAWGAPQAEFRKGFATVTDDPDAVKAALAQPGVVLRRPFGSKEAFAVEPARPTIKASHRPKPKPDEKQAHETKLTERKRRQAERAQAKKQLQSKLAALEAQEKTLAEARKAARAEFKSRLKRAQ